MRPILTIFKAVVMFKTVHSFIGFEKSLMFTIERGDIEEITERINPRALTNARPIHCIWQ